MSATFVCSHCKCVCQRNPRLKKQSYCSSPACQNARKRLHEKAVNATAKGKAAKKQRNESWRKNHNAHAYQACYRECHPEYVENNRLQQRERNLDRAEKSISKIVKTDALTLQPFIDKGYKGFEIKQVKIVKTDTLMLVMQPRRQLQGVSATYPA